MPLLNSFIHGEALTEFLIEGHNPHARVKLATADVDALRQHMQTGETLHAYVSGRVVMSGRGVWALTERHLLLRNTSQEGVIRLDVGQIERFEAVRGRYGHTVRVFAQGRGHSMYGVDAELAQTMQRALVALGVASSFEDKPARGTFRNSTPSCPPS
ncbi:MAG: hypothetical protein QM527_03150 [Alphaproteobacteria bacterium]|nr:hypothetical protein [Alphaproteobacteria bacterium]